MARDFSFPHSQSLCANPFSSSTHRIHHRNGSNMHDIAHIVASLEHMHWRADAEQNRSDGERVAETCEQLVRDVGRLKRWEHEHVGVLYFAKGIDRKSTRLN